MRTVYALHKPEFSVKRVVEKNSIEKRPLTETNNINKPINIVLRN